MEDKLRVALLTAFTPAAWSTTYYVTTEFLPPDRPLFSGLIRALPVGLVILAFTRELPRGIWWLRALVLGVLNIGAFFTLIFLAAYRLPGGLAATLTAIAPIMMMLMAWVLIRERPHVLSILGAVIGFAGVALLVLRAGFVVDTVGVIASLAAITMASLGFILVKRWTPPVSLVTFTGWQLVAGGLALLPVALIVEGPPPSLDARAVGGFLWICVIGTGLAYVVWFNGLRQLEAGSVALIGLLNPVVGTLIGVVLAGEAFGMTQALGMALVLGGVLLGQPAVRDRLMTSLATPEITREVGHTPDEPLPELVGCVQTEVRA